MFLLGVLGCGALAWPRVTPQVIYYGDMQRRLYHADEHCAYSHSPTFASRDEAEAAKLEPCRRCLPGDGYQVAHRDRDRGQQESQ